MSLLPEEQKKAIDPVTGEKYYWRGWHDGVRTHGRNVILRNSRGPSHHVKGEMRAQVVGRVMPAFKTLPRYVDLFLYEAEDGWVCQRRWISEAKGESPCLYEIIESPSLLSLRDKLMDWDPCEEAYTLWPDDVPGGKRRSERMRNWLRLHYESRVNTLIDLVTMKATDLPRQESVQHCECGREIKPGARYCGGGRCYGV